MCGICGYISRNKYDNKILHAMNDTMLHRGPDDEGIYIRQMRGGGYAGLAHRRLAIQDLSPAGRQPMVSEDGNTVIVYNGEVYNFQELRKDLEIKGYKFKSNCDTEVILNLYQQTGIRCLNLLNGMFSIAIFDFKEEKLFLARDRMGKKPLYYYMPQNSEHFVFASELKPIMKFPEFHKEIRAELISAYLVNKSIDSPDTIFADVYKIEPGQYIVWQNGSIRKSSYWSLLEAYKKNSNKIIENYETAKKELKNLLLDAVSKRLIADVPVGTFLSGGIDSSLITALVKEVSEKPVRTFTIGFYSKEKNEAEYAKKIAGYLGTEHTERYVSSKELFEQIRELAVYYDEPFHDSSQIPSMLVAQTARKDTTVILSGDGGDELFCGYEKYDWMKWVQRFDKIGALGNMLCDFPGIRKLNLKDRCPDKLYSFLNNRDPDMKLQLFNDVRERYTKKQIIGESVISKHEAYEKEIHRIESIKSNWQMQAMLFDMRYYLADEVLVKTDRASMRYSLELRCPILDYRVVEFSFCLPQHFKYYKNKKKRILKDLAYDMMPKELLDRPKKGFGVPLAIWLREELHDQLMRYADKDRLLRQGIFVPEKIHEFIEKMMVLDTSVYNSILWGFFVFQMWYQEYIEDLWN